MFLKGSEAAEDSPRPSDQCPLAGDGKVGVWAEPGHEWRSREKQGPSGLSSRAQLGSGRESGGGDAVGVNVKGQGREQSDV